MLARAIIDANRYMVLGTADAEGRPWVSPVWFAPGGGRQFLWVSAPDAAHSRNLAARPELSAVIFDSTVPAGAGQAVYLSGTGAELDGDERAAAIEVYSAHSLAHGGPAWSVEDVRAPARLRLYRAVAGEAWILGEHDRRVPADLSEERP
jgi:nitroimidazol reductase NimA-like FMN-containing flavoprotein (pyridoxamine 5'-phosphate oxidase superfamily)